MSDRTIFVSIAPSRGGRAQICWQTTMDEQARARLVATHEAMILAWREGRRGEARDHAKTAETIAPAVYQKLYMRYASLLDGDTGNAWIDLSGG